MFLIEAMKEFNIDLNDLIQMGNPRSKSQLLLNLRDKHHGEIQLLLNTRGNIISHKDKNKMVGVRLRITNMMHHKYYLKTLGWFNLDNGTINKPLIPAYSLIHSLEEQLSILIYTYTHNTRLTPEMCLHFNMAVILILNR